jgi:hypothetical protein
LENGGDSAIQIKSGNVASWQGPRGLTADLDQQGFAIGHDGAITEFGARCDLEPSRRLPYDLGAKGDAFTYTHGTAQAYFQARGYGSDATEPERIHHALIENCGQNPTMGDTSKPLKAFGNDTDGSHTREALRLEVEVKAIRVVLTADETALIILKFHGMASGMTYICDAANNPS